MTSNADVVKKNYTITCLYYVSISATDAGTVADMAATRKQRNIRLYLQHTGSSL